MPFQPLPRLCSRASSAVAYDLVIIPRSYFLPQPHWSPQPFAGLNMRHTYRVRYPAASTNNIPVIIYCQIISFYFKAWYAISAVMYASPVIDTSCIAGHFQRLVSRFTAASVLMHCIANA